MNQYVRKYYDASLDIFGLPQTYRGLQLYPIKMKDKRYHDLFFELLTYPKNTITQKEVIKMSYAKFLIYGISHMENLDAMRNTVCQFLEYITRQPVTMEETVKAPVINSYADFEVFFHIGDKTFTESDFDNMREIILEQNGLSIDYVDAFNPDLEKTLAFLMKKNPTTQEDQITVMCALSGKSIEDVAQMSIYQFQQLYERLLMLEEYRLYQPLLASGEVKIESGKIEHFGTHLKRKGRYDSILINVNDLPEENKKMLKVPPKK